MHESSKSALQPKDFTQINKSLIKKSVKEEKLPEKELRKKFNSVRKKVKDKTKKTRQFRKTNKYVQ